MTPMFRISKDLFFMTYSIWYMSEDKVARCTYRFLIKKKVRDDPIEPFLAEKCPVFTRCIACKFLKGSIERRFRVKTDRIEYLGDVFLVTGILF